MSLSKIKFKKRISIAQIEESSDFCPKFSSDGLLPCITVEKNSKTILMFSYITEEALKKTIKTRKGHYFSRSRNNIWLKGEVSGMFHEIKDIYVDDDQDSIIYEVTLNDPKKGGSKASCHVGYKSCFYRKISIKETQIELEFIEKEKVFNPELVYNGVSNPTKV